MRRRKLKYDSKHATTSELRNAVENRYSDMPYGGPVKPKRVRFGSPRLDNAHDQVSYRQNKTTECPKSNQPKTSEFAYFRRVKSNAVQAHSCLLPKLKEKLKGSQLSSDSQATTGEQKLLPSNKNLKFSDTGERAELFEHHHSIAGHDDSHITETEVANKRISVSSSLLPESVVTPVRKSRCMSPPNETSESSEKQCPEKGTFSEKRHRLRQWAAQTLSSDVENSHLKGLDLVSSLMSRLLPKDNRNDDSSGGTDEKRKSPDVYESSNYAIGRDISDSRDRDKDRRENCAGRSNEIVLSKRYKSTPRFPCPSYDPQINFRDDKRDLHQHWRSHLTRASDTWNGSSFFLPYERCQCSSPSHLNDMDDLHEHARKRDQLASLEWDFIRYSRPRLATSGNFESQLCANDISERKITCSSSENDYLEQYMMPRFNSTSNVTGDFGPYLTELEHTIAEPMQLTLAKPSTSNFTFCYDYNHDRFMDNVWDLKPYADYWMKCLSASDSYSPSIFRAWDCQLPEIKHSSRSFSRLETSSGEEFKGMSQDRYFNFQALFDSYIERPVLLDVVKDDESAKESFFYDGDGNGFEV